MACPLRREFPGALYHVTSRGERREDIYADDEDRRVLLDRLGAVCERCEWTVYADCLMSNHYHLLVETRQGNLSRGMRRLNGVYTQAFNRRHTRVGHVFQGRYKVILVDKDDALADFVVRMNFQAVTPCIATSTIFKCAAISRTCDLRASVLRLHLHFHLDGPWIEARASRTVYRTVGQQGQQIRAFQFAAFRRSCRQNGHGIHAQLVLEGVQEAGSWRWKMVERSKHIRRSQRKISRIRYQWPIS